MVRLFVSDIDGCLSEPFQAYDLERLLLVRKFAFQGGIPGTSDLYPAFTICSGRPEPYVEAMAQVLGLQVPVIFEAGGGMFDPVAGRIVWNPIFTDSMAEQIFAVREWMLKVCIPQSSMSFDHGKRTQAGMIGPDLAEVAHYVGVVEEFVATNFPDLRVFHTPISIDVSTQEVTKRQAMHWLAGLTGVPVSDMAFIGDTNGDIGALEEVGYALAPANATLEVRQTAHVVMQGTVTRGVIEAYEWCVNRNGR